MTAADFVKIWVLSVEDVRFSVCLMMPSELFRLRSDYDLF
jgi:hypothetical protein